MKTLFHNQIFCSALLLYYAAVVCINKPLSAQQNSAQKVSAPIHNKNSKILKRRTLQPHPTPSIWTLLAQNKRVSPEDKKQFFINDCAKARTTNTVIPLHRMNQTSVRVASYNVNCWTDPHDKQNYKNIMQAIKQTGADIIVLQDMHLFNNVTISSDLVALGYKYHAFFSMTSFNLPYGKAPFGILISSKYPFTQPPRSYNFTIDQQRGDHRGFINVHVKLPQTIILSLYATHFDGDDITEEQRVAEVTELIKNVVQDKNPNCCILADVNGIRKEDYKYTIQGKKIWDLLVADDCRRIPGLCSTRYPTTTFDLLTKAGFSDCFTKMAVTKPKFTAWPGKMIDFIMLKKEWTLPIMGCYVAYTAASDHCPVIMDMGLTYTKNSKIA